MSNNGRKTIELPANITVRQLADLIKASPIDIIKQLMSNGMMATINQQIDYDTAAIVISEFGYEAQPQIVEEAKEEEQGTSAEWRKIIEKEAAEDLVVRPPVVTILGHVDHGKTSLLDAIRHSNVAAGEAGGITQHIGAYQVVHNERKITFLDTPGHEAFTAMRARGAQTTDIAVLVVAADDGVMPQTREAAAHAKAARVPIIVALNKIDKPNANPDRVKQQLSDIDLTPDEWGGKTMIVPVSAKQKKGIDDLLEAIVLVADDTPIKANPNTTAAGTVVEAQLDKARGVVATLLVQNGTLRTGDILIAGMVSGRIRRMFNDKGQVIDEAPPSTPVSILGLSDIPTAGDIFRAVGTDREARETVARRKQEQKAAAAKPSKALTLDQVFAKFQAGESKELPLVVKADGQGSLEPIVTSLEKLSTEDIRVTILYAETGNVTENDVLLASASKAIVVGFAVAADQAAQRLADTEGVSIRMYDIIYRLTEDIEKALKGMLEPEYKDVLIGKAEVRQVFRIPKVGNIAGSFVREGEIRRNATARVMRGGQKIFEGTVSSLKHLKDDVREVRQGFECGIAFDGFDSFKTGDLIEFYTKEQVE
ncbi:MAG TPA: translation initiation factor IF-2 [Anaerolineales bacterium]|nr:translation initiation factor IF-2 [Anaerolineales bacterium]